MDGNRFEKPSRKRNRLKGYDYSQDGLYFVTICTKNKQYYFWDLSKPVGGDAHIAPPFNDISTSLPYRLTSVGELVEKHLTAMTGITKYVIMPNHIHFIVAIRNDNTCGGAMWASPPTQSLSQLVRSLKTLVTKEAGFSPWQRNYYDRILRNEYEYRSAWRYIEENPVKWEQDELFTNE